MRRGGDIRIAGLLAAAVFAILPSSSCRRDSGESAIRAVERVEAVGPGQVTLRSELRPARGTVGDPIAWRLSAEIRGHARPETLTLGEIPPALDMSPSPPRATRSRGQAAAWSREYRVHGFDLGAMPLPTALLILRDGVRRDTLAFPPDTIFVDSLTQAITGSLRPDRGAIDPELRPLDYAVAAGAVLLLVILVATAVALLIRAVRRRGSAPGPTVPPEPPEDALERALAALRGDLQSLPRDVFYERLSFALRSYAAAVTGLPALDLTTDELDRALDGRAAAAPLGRRILIATLKRSDLAKFAAYQDPVAEATAALREAEGVPGTLTAGMG